MLNDILGPNFAPELTASKALPFFAAAIQSLGESVIVDSELRMIFISDDYAKTMGIDLQKSLGQKITDVLDSTEIPLVLKSGRAIRNALYVRNGKSFWVHRFPIFEKDSDKPAGVLAMCLLSSEIQSNEMRRQLSLLTRETNYYKTKYLQSSVPRYGIDNIVTQSPTMLALKEMLSQISSTPSTVLLTGESGTGKEVFANAIHSASPRHDKPFVRINCAAVPDSLLEAELFGYEEGSFTGALKGGKVGDFEAANGGSILLDEVDAFPLSMQAKLLRVIQEKEVKKVGSSTVTPIDVRFIFATNKNLADLVKQGLFREDFYYRINVIHFEIPPLRERREDIPLLVDWFVEKYNREFGMNVAGVEQSVIPVLQTYKWPGNIRELENYVERAFNYSHGSGKLTLEQFFPQPHKLPHVSAENEQLTLKTIREQAERHAILRTLEEAEWNKKETARRLGIDRSQLYEKMNRYHIEK